MFDPVLQFALELIRAILVDELSEHVRSHVSRLGSGGRIRGRKQWLLRIFKRDRNRVMHKLHTESKQEP